MNRDPHNAMDANEGPTTPDFSNQRWGPNSLYPFDTPDVEGTARSISGYIEQMLEAKQAIELKIEKARKLLQSLNAFSQPDTTIGEVPARKAKRKKKYQENSLPARIVAEARRVLLSEGRPMTRRELLGRFSSMHIELTMREPDRYVARMLREDPDFVHVEKRGYWLVDHPLPDGP